MKYKDTFMMKGSLDFNNYVNVHAIIININEYLQNSTFFLA